MATFTLHKETVQPWLPLRRAYTIFHLICILFLFYYRISNLFISYPWILMTLAEIILSFMWLFNQAFRWRLVNRSVRVCLVREFWRGGEERGGEIFNLKCLVQFLEGEGSEANFIALSKLSSY